MAHDTLIRFLTTTALVLATGVATAVPAGAEPSPASVQADLDGDGADDRVGLVRGPDGTWELRAELPSGVESAQLADDERIPEVGLRVSDVDADGRHEVVAPVSVGANTVAFQVFLHDPELGLVPVSRRDGHPFFLYEGGGVAAVNGYGCATDHDERTLVVVGATLEEGEGARYEGHRSNYAVSGGIVRPLHHAPIRGVPASDPVLATDPATCAPGG